MEDALDGEETIRIISAREADSAEGRIYTYQAFDPALSKKQLAEFQRAPKKLVAVRLDADVLDWIRRFGPGYSTRINSVLRVVMSQQQR